MLAFVGSDCDGDGHHGSGHKVYKVSETGNLSMSTGFGYHISLVRRNVVSDCTKTGLVGMRRPARGICAHSEIGEESQCRAGRVSF